MKTILAVDKNFAIGYEGNLLFHIKKDFKHFKELTTGNVVILGKNSLKSMGNKPLKNRENIILTRDKNFKLDNALIFHSKKDVLNYVKNVKKDVFVIGGAKTVELFLDEINEAYITKVFEEKKADTYLFNFEKDKNRKIKEQSEIFEEDDIKFQFVTYEKIK
ncbi:MAG: dihydrofolate reductase [Peptoniphilaceae bacterium]|nr:dihydrofolate reductase [Peptoniphilaceae bacterium]MDD7383176.1 dihydrofolate reductase [Peptoniphilaceae bacterium]MDY3738400.1 dihydrofolate reductase [Peptoniphilaceae bacterium]